MCPGVRRAWCGRAAADRVSPIQAACSPLDQAAMRGRSRECGRSGIPGARRSTRPRSPGDRGSGREEGEVVLHPD